MRQPSALERAFSDQLRMSSLPAPVQEHRFDSTRRFRFDFAWPAQKLAVEVEGGHWVAGRHTRGKGFDADCAKYACATLQGWRVLRVTRTHIQNGQALAWTVEALGGRA